MTQLRQRKNDELNIIAFDQSGESAADAFEINATDFMLKPATASRTLKAIRKITTKKDSQEKGRNTGNNSLFVKEKGRLVRIFLNDIYLVEALADYVNIYTLSKKYTVHSTMKNIESELQKSNFIRVHKSYIARIDRISEIRKDSLIIEKQTVPIGQSYRKTLIDQLKIV